MSQDDNLLNLTSAHLDIGLRGIPVGTCRTSFVTPGEGVHYCGYPISELADFLPEDIVYLLFNKELPTQQQSEAFVKELQSRGDVPEEINTIFATLPKDGHPMDWLSIGIHSLGMLTKENDWTEDALDLVAKMPRLLGLIFRYREGRHEDIPEDNLNLNLVERFTHTLDFEDVDREAMNKILATYLFYTWTMAAEIYLPSLVKQSHLDTQQYIPLWLVQ